MTRLTTGMGMVSLVLAMSPVTLAGTWDEVGDAPAWPGATSWQSTVGFGPLTAIRGTTSLALGDLVDAYGITITDPVDFYATTSALTDPNGTASFDTRLWLFNVDGTPVLGNYAEYDAVPGCSQQAVPYQAPREGLHPWAPGHTDPHSALGVAQLIGLLGAKAAMSRRDRRPM